jgi:putative peptidoglycan lipid II flippase
MLGRIFTVGGYTLLSRITGFARDIMLAAILGAGPVADAFFVALRLPNHFRRDLCGGAFNAAFVPAYAHVRGERGEASAGCSPTVSSCCSFRNWSCSSSPGCFHAQAMSIHTGFTEDAEQRRLRRADADHLPYLLLITLVTLYGGILNVMHRSPAPRRADLPQPRDDDAGAGGVVSSRPRGGGAS